MPYLKQKKQDPMTRLIRSYGYNGNNLVPILGKSQPTCQKKLDYPETLTLEDLRNLGKRAHIPADEIRAAISFA